MRHKRLFGSVAVVAAVVALASACIFEGSWLPAVPGTEAQVVATGAVDNVDCVTPSWCLSAGGSPYGAQLGAAGAWDGAVWRPAPAPPTRVTDLDCAAVDDCWAIGGGRLHHFDGTSWSTPAWPGATTARAVSCPAPGWCGVVADVGTTSTVLGWDGTTGLDLAVPAAHLSDIACPATNWCMAGGGLATGAAFTAQWTGGTTWTTDDVAGLGYLTMVDCASTTTCAVASGSWPSGPTDGIAVWTAGSGWSPFSAAKVGPGVECGPGVCLAFGDLYDLFDLQTGSEVTGLVGSPLPAAISGTRFADVACSGPTDCVYVEGPDLIHRWNGSTWALDAVDLASVHAESAPKISCAPGGTCLATALADGNPVAIGTDGTTVDPVALPVGPGSYPDSAVSCVDGGWCAVALRVDSWDHYSGMPISALDLVTGTDGARVPRRFDYDDVGDAAYGGSVVIDCLSPTWCLAVVGGSQGAATLRWDGTSWSTLAPIGVAAAPTGLACLSPTSCVLLTDSAQTSGELRRFDGTSFAPPIVAPDAPEGEAELTGVGCLPDSSCLAVGGGVENGVWAPWAVRLAGDGTISPSPMQDFIDGPGNLRDISCTAIGECLAVGDATINGTNRPVAIAWRGQWGWLGEALPTLADGTTRWDAVSCAEQHCTVAGTTTLTAGGTRVDVARFTWPQ